MAKAPPTIAATSTLAMIRTAEARGIETADLLERAGLSRELIENPDTRLPGPTVMVLWNALRERAADPALQLSAPEALPFGAYRVIDYLVAASATIGDGMTRFARFFRLIADAVALTITRDGDAHCICLSMADGSAVPPVYVDYILAALVRRLRMRIKPDLNVNRVEFRQLAPVNIEPYTECFMAPLRFNAPIDRLSFSDDEWNSAALDADAALAHLLEEHARMLAQRLPRDDFRAEVEKQIACGLPDGGSAEDVARAMHMSVRTLQRKLLATGTTFREVYETVRHRLAEDYMTDPKVSIAEVAFLLGFSEQSSFNRGFRRWTGMSPGQWRRKRR